MLAILFIGVAAFEVSGGFGSDTGAVLVAVACTAAIGVIACGVCVPSVLRRNEIAAVEREIKRLKQRVRELLKTSGGAEHLAEKRARMVAHVSHEIRSPLTSVLGYTGMLLEACDPAQAEALNTIKRNGEYLLQVVNNVLDASKLEAGRMGVELVPVCVKTILKEVSDLLKHKAARKGVELSFDAAAGLPDRVLTDPTRLRQILINLADNAVKFTEAGEVRIVASYLSDDAPSDVRPDHQPAGPRLVVDVVDTGSGIAKDELGCVFDQFSQGDSPTVRLNGGSGLGLAISRNLARRLGGDLLVESTPGEGSRFTLIISAELPDESWSSRFDASKSSPKENGRSEAALSLDCRVLVADDAPDVQRLTTYLLDRAGAKVDAADNGRIACEMVVSAALSGAPYDVVLMDLKMPVLDGCAATRALREQGCTTPIIALTAGDSDEAESLAAGCNAYIVKPVQRETLVATIRRYIAEGAQQAVVESEIHDQCPPPTNGRIKAPRFSAGASRE